MRAKFAPPRRPTRGAVSEILAPAGWDTHNLAFDFGETSVTLQSNAVSHTTERVVDDLGRVNEETDPNGGGPPDHLTADQWMVRQGGSRAVRG